MSRPVKRKHWRGAAGVLLFATAAVFADPSEPVPSDAKVTAGITRVNEVYAEDIKSAKTPAAKASLAAKMLAAGEGETDLATKYALLTRSMELDESAGNLTGACAAIDHMAAVFVIDPLPAKVAAATATAKSFKSQPGMNPADLIRAASTLADAAVAVDRYDLAITADDAAAAAAQSGPAANLVQRHRRQTLATKAAYDRIRADVAALAAKADDPAANLAVGRFRAFVKGDWDGALPLFVLCGDPAIRSAAETETKNPSAFFVIGDAWDQITKIEPAADRYPLLLHASGKYAAAIPTSAGLQEAQIESRLTAIMAEIEKSGRSTPPPGLVLCLAFSTGDLAGSRKDSVVRDTGPGRLELPAHEVTFGRAKSGSFGQEADFTGGAWMDGKAFGEFPAGPAFTISAMVKVPKKMTGPIVSKHDWARDGTHGVALEMVDSRPKFIIGTADGWKQLTAEEPLIPDEWHHLAATSDGKQMRLYVDGVEATSDDMDSAVDLSTFPMEIGRCAYEPSRVFTGSMGDVMLFDRALKPGQIAELAARKY
jgi:hypothetical protein